MLRFLPILFCFLFTVVQAEDSVRHAQTWVDSYMPWIVALIIGVFSAWVNHRIAKTQRISNEKNQQLQMNNIKEITLLQFKGRIASQNKQQWVNDLREEISELLTKSYALAQEFHNVIKEEEIDDNLFRANRDQLHYSESKIKLLLNINNEDQRELLESIDKMINYMLKAKGFRWEKFNGLRSDVVDSARILFEGHWEKIKNLK